MAKRKQNNPFQLDTIAWIIGSFVAIYYSEIITALQVDYRISGTYFHIAFGSTTATFLIFMYIIIWVNYIKGIDSNNWEKDTPYAIPLATIMGIVSGVFWNIALWPVYSYWTPGLVFVIFMGFVMTASILPPWSNEAQKAD